MKENHVDGKFLIYSCKREKMTQKNAQALDGMGVEFHSGAISKHDPKCPITSSYPNQREALRYPFFLNAQDCQTSNDITV